MMAVRQWRVARDAGPRGLDSARDFERSHKRARGRRRSDDAHGENKRSGNENAGTWQRRNGLQCFDLAAEQAAASATVLLAHD